MEKNKRAYSWEIIIYSDINTIKKTLLNWHLIQNYLFAYHSLDYTTEGSLTKPHTHCYLTFLTRVSPAYVARHVNLYSDGLYEVSSNLVESIKGSLQDCYSYALHKNCTKDELQYKHVYDDNILDCSNLRLFKRTFADKENVSYQILLDLEAHLPLRTLAQKYGRDLIIHYTAYRDFLDRIKEEEQNKTAVSHDPADLIDF